MGRTHWTPKSIPSMFLGAIGGGALGPVVALVITLLVSWFWSPDRAEGPYLEPTHGGVVGSVRAYGNAAEKYQFSMTVLGVQIVAVLGAGLAALLASLAGSRQGGVLLGALGPAL